MSLKRIGPALSQKKAPVLKCSRPHWCHRALCLCRRLLCSSKPLRGPRCLGGRKRCGESSRGASRPSRPWTATSSTTPRRGSQRTPARQRRPLRTPSARCSRGRSRASRTRTLALCATPCAPRSTRGARPRCRLLRRAARAAAAGSRGGPCASATSGTSLGRTSTAAPPSRPTWRARRAGKSANCRSASARGSRRRRGARLPPRRGQGRGPRQLPNGSRS
mmetsp:Transcript_31493/g.74858  ORF Transcript_31493/g.74858 Transcript_31493/m.74858 type:complete len:220 (+) Transcript_31493:373-1032(+)